jgi:hypothetical protein
VRIPIDRAKDLLVERGLPVRAQNHQMQTVMIANASSSGRTMIARDQRIPSSTPSATEGNHHTEGGASH